MGADAVADVEGEHRSRTRTEQPLADALFEDARLAALYDHVEQVRLDLAVYVAMAEEFGATSVIDVGCGTGTFACMLAERGIEVTGVDPARASLDVARAKPFSDRVRWVLGDASALTHPGADLITMTGNVAQVFLTDASWSSALGSARSVLVDGGRLAFEVRDPKARAWRTWTKASTYRRVPLPQGGPVEVWTDHVREDLPRVSFRQTFVFPDATVLTSDSTLRFRDEEEVRTSLRQAGFVVEGVRDAPDRPGLELVFVATPR